MVKIVITKEFWVSSILTAYELFSFTNDAGERESYECLGSVWGNREADVFTAKLATTTQLIKNRDNESVEGPDPWKHVMHSAWAVQDVTGLNYLGSFHSHPWSEDEIVDCKAKGFVDEDFFRASSADCESMNDKTIEIILSLRPLVSVGTDQYRWQMAGDIVAGQVDLAHATFSGWYRDDNGKVKQVPISMIASDISIINQRLDSRA